MQAVVSTGESPLPAEVRLKADPVHGGKFFGIFPVEWSVSDIETPTYNNVLQIKLRKLICEVVVRIFNEMKYTFEINRKYNSSFPKHSEVMIDKAIEIVDSVAERMCTVQERGAGSAFTTEERFAELVRHLTTGYIAELCLDLTHTFRTNKNWNWHGSSVGASIGSIASLLSSLNGGKLEINFRQKIPKGVVLTGSKHGHHDVHYVEYMSAPPEDDEMLENTPNFLNHAEFWKHKHGDKVKQIMDVAVQYTVTPPGTPSDPQPQPKVVKHPTARPTRAHTVDFAVTWRGVHLLDGECKDKSTDADEHVLVFHSVEQLAYKDTALALMTTSTQMKLFESTKNPDTGRIVTKYHEFPKYTLGGVPYLTVDLDAQDNEAIQCVPSFWARDTEKSGRHSFREVREKEGTELWHMWKDMRSEPRRLIVCMLKCIDLLYHKFACVNFTKVAKNKDDSYKMGFTEPRFMSTRERDLKTRRAIPNSRRFVYNRENMTGVPKYDHKSMAVELEEILQNTPQETMSDELRGTLDELLKKHRQYLPQ